MLLLTDRASILRSLDDPDLDSDLRALIRKLAVELHHDTKLYVVQGGDTAAVINAAVGFAITGDDPETCDYDWLEDHEGRWFEIGLVRDDGVPVCIFVENDPGTELGIHGLCLSRFWPDEEGEGR